MTKMTKMTKRTRLEVTIAGNQRPEDWLNLKPLDPQQGLPGEITRAMLALGKSTIDAAGWFNLIHLHGSDVMFDLATAYPTQAINWHDQETPPTLSEGQAKFLGAVCGGIRQWETMVRGTPYMARAEVEKTARSTGGRRLVVGTGCVTPIIAPTSNIRAARQAVEDIRGI